jgi:signal transduction histidine kinase
VTWAWAVGVGGPTLIALLALPFRSTFGLSGVLFLTLLIVAATSALGGIRPAVAAVVVGVAAGAFAFAPPYGHLRVDPKGDVAALIAFVLVGVGIALLVDELGQLAEQQAALRRVATLVAGGAPPEDVFGAVAKEVGELLAVDLTNLSCYGTDGTMTIVASWSRTGTDNPAVGMQVALGGQNLSTLVAETGRSARMDRYEESSGAVSTVARSVGARSAVATPIFVAGHLWGVLIAASVQERPLPRDTEEQVSRFTDLLATGIANAESRRQLAASRARVVTAADDTRRRIERDLHDGTQQRLVSLGLELRAAEQAVPAEMTAIRGHLTGVADGLTEALEDLQEIARGIHPAVLTKGGLAPAIKTLARRSAVPVELDLRAEGRLPERVEVAAYYVVAEALTNAAKHAHASVVHIDGAVDSDGLHLSIRDNGRGGAVSTRGSGLIGLRDRVESIGGSIEIASAVGSGTSLIVDIPIIAT